MSAAREIERQRRRDRHYRPNLDLLGARLHAVVDAQRAIAAREVGAGPALRQSLIDVAAVAAALADDLSP